MTHPAMRILSVSVVKLKDLASFSHRKKKSLTKIALLFSVQMLTLLNGHFLPSSHFVGNTSTLINDLSYTWNQTTKCIKNSQ